MSNALPAATRSPGGAVRQRILRAAMLVAGVVIWSATATAASAQSGEEESGPSYGLSWLLVLLCVALGVFVTVRPSGRKQEMKRPRRDD